MTAELASTTFLSTRDRRALIAAFALTSSVAYVAMIQILPVILVPMAADLGVTRTAVAAASTISTLVGAVVSLPVGKLLDKHGGRTLMTVGSGLGAVAVLWWSQVESLWGLYAAFVLIGISLVMSTYEAAFAVIVVSAGPHERDRAILAVTMIAGLATYLVYPLLGWMYTEYGWRTTLVILAVTLAVCGIPAQWFAIPSRERHQMSRASRAGLPLRAALGTRRFWLMSVAFVAQAGSVSAFLLLVVAYLIDVGHSPAVATSIPVVIGLLQVLSRLALSTVARRVRLVPATSVAFVVQGVGLLLLPTVGLSIPLTIACVAAVGLGQGIGVIARPSVVAQGFGPAHFASVLAAITVPMALARAGSPLVAAWLADWRFLVGCGVVALIGGAALIPLFGLPAYEDVVDELEER